MAEAARVEVSDWLTPGKRQLRQWMSSVLWWDSEMQAGNYFVLIFIWVLDKGNVRLLQQFRWWLQIRCWILPLSFPNVITTISKGALKKRFLGLMVQRLWKYLFWRISSFSHSKNGFIFIIKTVHDNSNQTYTHFFFTWKGYCTWF